MTSRKIWWIVAAVVIGTAGYLYFSQREESYGLKALPGGRVTSDLFPSRAPANGPTPATAQRGESKSAPPTGLRVVDPESSSAPGRKP